MNTCAQAKSYLALESRQIIGEWSSFFLTKLATAIADHQITRSPDHQITRSPDHQITRSPDHQVILPQN